MPSWWAEACGVDETRTLPGTPCGAADERTVDTRTRFVLGRLGTQRPRLLDVGCGRGAYLNRLAPSCSLVVGIDANEAYLRQALVSRHADHIHLVQMGAESLAFAHNSFDVVVMLEVLEHLPHPDAAMKATFACLRPRGSLLISVPNKLFPVETHGVMIGDKVVSSPWGMGIPLLTLAPDRVRRAFATARVYRARELSGLLGASGFKVVELSFLWPSLDRMRQKLPRHMLWLPSALGTMFSWLERSAFGRFGSTILAHAVKPA